MSKLQISYRELPVYSLAAQQNAYRLFADASLHYRVPTETDEEEALPTLSNVTVRLTTTDDLLEPQVWEIGRLIPGQVVRLQDRVLEFGHNYLFDLSDETRLTFTFKVTSKDQPDEPLLEHSSVVTVLPANFWGGERRQPELLAAFIRPNGVYVESLVKQVTELLERNGHGRSADGYQSNTRERPYLMAAALWNVVLGQKISYVSPPPSFARQGQLIRLAREISNNRMGACLDLSILFASCLECMGLNSVIALTRDHATVGVWLIDSQFPLLTNDDPMDLRKRVDARDLVLFESTMVTNSNRPTFAQSCAHARSLIDEDKEADFVYVVDIAQARARKIRPLSTVEERQEEQSSTESAQHILAPPPPLPPVRSDEKVVEETPETRIDSWQRKLLDLSKRNPLLSLRENASAIRLYCTEIGAMEDMLADGGHFGFVSAEQSPINERERSAESFRLATGNDLHKQYAREQLSQHKLVANMSQNKLESSSVSLFRRAKEDLEEGGANTLFMALGMLRWKEDPRDERSYKAPLILIPVELTRSSARAPIKVKQLADEQPIFNLTLIEFLKVERDIDLNHLREELPEDDSGVDVAQVWQMVRDAIREEPGFEVVEESVIAAFSFAKYLMWKDLKDRIDDLKTNPFVAHLVDSPQKAYRQEAKFILHDQIDQKIDPADIYTPLNCDSSQMVAVEASGHPQDFVLEGPPGCGKSETIANIIAHNLAMRRKILFVAEKIAALHVVYRRLQKIHLDHVCLELHSNKANKKAVLDQLRRAVTRREEQSTQAWSELAARLRDRRDALNAFVEALHQPSEFGISPRSAIARVAAYRKNHKLNLGWEMAISEAPIRGEDGYQRLIEGARTVAIAYSDIESLEALPFKHVNARDWSNAWQTSVVGAISTFSTQVTATIADARAVAAQFNVALAGFSLDVLKRMQSLVVLTKLAERRDLAYVFGKNAKQKLALVEAIAKKKAALDALVQTIGHGVVAGTLAKTPIDDWLGWVNTSQASWFKRLFLKGKVNKAAKAVGLEPFNDLGVLQQIKAARSVHDEIARVVPTVEGLGLWHGWDTTSSELNAASREGLLARKLMQSAMVLVDEPATLLAPIKAKLIDGREYLDSSKLAAACVRFEESLNVLKSRLEEMGKLGIEVPGAQDLGEVSSQLQQVAEQSQKLKVWVEWNSAKEQASVIQLDVLCDALEARTVLPDDAESQVVTAFCDWLAPRLIDADEKLVKFKAIEHDQRIEEFRELDKQVADTTSQYIAAQLAESAPDINSQEHSQAFGSLSKELQKKTRHKPVRQLFEDMGERLLDLCPCMMMSPLSVAQFLPSDFNAFDLVVFDEASQMTVWDSVGAIARGKNVIVVGDPKQMPPTNFFNASFETGNTDEEDLESILDQALAARLPHLRLMGHYRSRHETLIAFSNSKYYDNSLITYPSSETKESAVTLHRVNGVYSKGKGRNNPIEAREVVAEVVRRLKHPKLCELSLGIVTMNTDQQRTIEDLLDDARRLHPEIEPFFHSSDNYDAVFVKNLESVQGDERDVVMFSLAYGPTEPGGRTMSMNFGPLNKSGGERRLNVAITRATTEVVIFSSFDSQMIDLSRTSAIAVEHLKHYLEFAERGPIALSQQSSADYGADQFDSDFEQAIAWNLRDKGWKVQTQVGVSKFRIDLGVVHPDFPGAYLAGIECDGATYHGSPSARDRDRTRQAILENLGWRLVRVWSTDYFQDPEAVLDRVHDRLNTILEEDRARMPEPIEVAVATSVQASNDDEPESEQQPVKVVARHAPEPGSFDDDSEKPDDTVEGQIYSSESYYEPQHEATLAEMARDILRQKPAITIKALALDIAQLHGLSRTSKRQIEHLARILKPWAGVWRDEEHLPVYWEAPEYVADLVEWRGVDTFGYDRDWSEIGFPEARGLAQQALEKQPDDPVDYICTAFKLKRRHAKTLKEFSQWVDSIR